MSTVESFGVHVVDDENQIWSHFWSHELQDNNVLVLKKDIEIFLEHRGR
jgi:hypothetical protein